MPLPVPTNVYEIGAAKAVAELSKATAKTRRRVLTNMDIVASIEVSRCQKIENVVSDRAECYLSGAPHHVTFGTRARRLSRSSACHCSGGCLALRHER